MSSNALAVGAILVGAPAATALPMDTTQQETTTTTMAEPPRKERVLCTCTYKCGASPGKYVHPSTRSAHRKRERLAVMTTTTMGGGAAEVVTTTREARDAYVADENLNARPQAHVADPLTTATTTSATAPAPPPVQVPSSSSSRYLTVPAIPTSSTSGLFQQQPSKPGAPVPEDVPSNSAHHRQQHQLPTRPLTELHMRNPAQVISPGSRRTTFTSFLPPPQPSVMQQQSVQVPSHPQPQALFPLNTNVNGNHYHPQNQNQNFVAGSRQDRPSFSSQNQKLQLPSPSHIISPTTTTSADPAPPGLLSTASHSRITAWVTAASSHTTDGDRLYAQALQRELDETRLRMLDAEARTEALAECAAKDKMTMEVELQRLEGENKRLKAQVMLRNHVSTSIQAFIKLHGHEHLPPVLRLPPSVPTQNAMYHYENFVSHLVQEQLHLTERAIRQSADATRKCSVTNSELSEGSHGVGEVKWEAPSSDDEMLVDSYTASSATTRTAQTTASYSDKLGRGHGHGHGHGHVPIHVHGGYQSLRSQPEKRRRV